MADDPGTEIQLPVSLNKDDNLLPDSVELLRRLGAISNPLIQILNPNGNAEDGDGRDDVVARARGAVDSVSPGNAEAVRRLLVAAASGAHYHVEVEAVLSAGAAGRVTCALSAEKAGVAKRDHATWHHIIAADVLHYCCKKSFTIIRTTVQ